MQSFSPEVLQHFQPTHEYFIGIDSDGCAFDSMELKHKECFIPAIIKHWNLQPICSYVREAAEFVNLYSKWRGINRLPALVKLFDLLNAWPDVQRRGAKIPDLSALRKFIDSGVPLGNPSLQKAVDETGDPILAQTLGWSQAVNDAVAEMVHGLPPMPLVRKSLTKLRKKADVIVVSVAPCETLQREWETNDIARFVDVFAGQEMGRKADQLRMATQGKYPKNHVLMMGDAPGDLWAAKQNNLLFYPIMPGREENSWERFYHEAMDAFLSGTYAVEYESKLIEEFETLLPSTPPWKKS